MFCQINDLRVHYEIYGEGNPVLILHGFPLDRRIMMGCMEPLFQHLSGYQRIYLDLPGMGKTEITSKIKSSDDILQFTLDFIDFLLPNENFLLVGESNGGYIASGITVKRKERVKGILLICPMLQPDFSKRKLPSREVLEREDKYFNTLSSEMQKEFDSILVIENKRVCSRYLQEIPDAMAIAKMEQLNQLQQTSYGFTWDLLNISEKFLIPALFICGRQDDIVGFQDAINFSEKFEHASVAVLDKAGHYAQVEQQEIFEKLVKDWLKKVE